MKKIEHVNLQLHGHHVYSVDVPAGVWHRGGRVGSRVPRPLDIHALCLIRVHSLHDVSRY